MIHVRVQIDDQATAPMLMRLTSGLRNRGALHARIAVEAQRFLKDAGVRISKNQHRTAEMLGAKPTRHLEKAYAAIESESSEAAAVIRVPRASRLRAAFGDYVVRPGSGKRYLTIPVHKDAYGRRAGEFPDLFFVRVGPRQTPALARKVSTGEGMEVMFFLTKAAKIRHAPELIPFDLLGQQAADAVEAYVDSLLGGGEARA